MNNDGEYVVDHARVESLIGEYETSVPEVVPDTLIPADPSQQE